jgi:hypothetical protein
MGQVESIGRLSHHEASEFGISTNGQALLKKTLDWLTLHLILEVKALSMIGNHRTFWERFTLRAPQSDHGGRELRHVGACDEAIQEITATNLPPRWAAVKRNSSGVTVSWWYHDLKKFFVDL